MDSVYANEIYRRWSAYSVCIKQMYIFLEAFSNKKHGALRICKNLIWLSLTKSL